TVTRATGEDAGAELGAGVGEVVSTFAASAGGAGAGGFCCEKKIAPAAVPASSSPAPLSANGNLRPRRPVFKRGPISAPAGSGAAAAAAAGDETSDFSGMVT